MKKSVRFLAAFLFVTMLFCSLPIPSFAKQDAEEAHMSEHTDGAFDLHGQGDSDLFSSHAPSVSVTVEGTGIPGDVNGDGKVSNADAILLYRFASGEDVPLDPEATDIDGNGLVDYEDVVALFRYVSGWANVEIGYGHGWSLTCRHTPVFVPAATASCDADGNIAYWRCDSCGLFFRDDSCKEVVSSADVTLSAYAQHTFTDWTVLSASTCTERGIRRHACISCGYEETVETEALSHAVEDFYTDKEPTCTEKGIKSGFCTLCDALVEEEIAPLGHIRGTPTEIESETCNGRAVGCVRCTRCNEVLSTYGHSYITTVTDATCETDGAVTKVCSRCDKTETTVLAHKGHTEGFLVEIEAATCTQTGKTAIGCLYCDFIFEETRAELPLEAHRYTVTETEDAYRFVCDGCSHSYEESKNTLTVRKITFVSEHGPNLSPLYLPEGMEAVLPLPFLEGFAFCGWFTDEACTDAFLDTYPETDITLYAKWQQREKPEDDGVISNVGSDFSFVIQADAIADPDAPEDAVLVMDAFNNLLPIRAEDMGGGKYKITPVGSYEEGELYRIVLRNGASFADYAGRELWFSTEEENAYDVAVRPGVILLDRADIYAITEGENDTWYLMLDGDCLDLGNYFVIYDGDESNVIYSGKIYEESTFDRYFLYRIDELTEDEIPEVFVDIDIHYEGRAELGDFVPDEGMIENAEQEFMQSALYSQIHTASLMFASRAGGGKYYYDYHYPKISTDVKREDSKIIFTFTVDVTFGRLDTETREVKDLYTVTFKIKNETVFNVTAEAESTSHYELILSPVNTTTVGIYAKAGGKVVSDERLKFFKELFIKAKDEGKTDPLGSTAAEHRKDSPLGIIPVFAIPGVTVDVEIYNVFSFEAIGEIGFEVVTELSPTVGIANYGGGVKLIKDFSYAMSVHAYAHAKVHISDRLGVKANFSLLGMIHAAAGVEVGPYAEVGGLLNIVVEWGSDKPFNFGASAGGYIEAGIELEAFLELKITTLIFKHELYEHRWVLFDTTYVLFSLGNKEMPIKFVATEAPITRKADLLYGISLLTDISTEVEYQNLKTLAVTKKKPNVSFEILNKPDYASINSQGVLVLNEKAADLTFVDLEIKVSYKSLFKIIDVRVYIEHDYSDDFTCHDRTCLHCGYVSLASTPHVFSDWEAVEGGACTPDPYSMRICFDCRICEYSDPDAGAAAHHDYQIISEESVEPTCTEDGYLVYRCVREHCTSETKIAVIKRYGRHSLIWVDGGEYHYQHCQRVGCGYDTKQSDHTSTATLSCTEDRTCTLCGHVMEEASGHDYVAVPSLAATCTEDGYYSYMECSICHDRQGYTVIPALRHTYHVSFRWNGFRGATATAVCENGHSETYRLTVHTRVVKAATCTSPGESIHRVSVEIDGVVYEDTRTETVLPLGHNILSVNAAEPTCTSIGWDAYEFCTRCSHTTKVIRKALPHTGGTASCTARAECDVCGTPYGEKLPHTYGDEYSGNAAGHFRLCSCGARTPRANHVPNRSMPSETEAKVCTVCDYVILPATGHVKHNFTLLMQDGSHHWYRCESCEETTAKTPHSGYIPESCLDRSVCVECGEIYGAYGPHHDVLYKNADVHWSVCSVCHRVADKEAHHGGSATCTDRPVCIDCGEIYGETTEHLYSRGWGYNSESHFHVCACGATKDTAAHIRDRETPTETLPVKCSICDYVMEAATGHVTHSYTVLKYDAEKHWRKCSGCDKTVSEELHYGGERDCTHRAACAVCGTLYGDEPDHTYVMKSNSLVHWWECTVCDFKGEPISHEGGHASCEMKAVCDICGKLYGELLDHDYRYTYDALQHYEICKVCQHINSTGAHTGGKSTCTTYAMCDICFAYYGTVIGHHTPMADDGDCTTAILCALCRVTLTNGKAHSFKNGCDTDCNNENCQYTRITSHTPEEDDGDCTTALFCAECGKVAKEARPSHTGGTASCTHKARCSECGTAYGEMLPHTPEEDDGDCTTALLCAKCDAVIVAAKQHTGGVATCVQKAKCDTCGMEYGVFRSHTPEADDGDCTTAVICSVCGDVTREALQHSFRNGCDKSCNNLLCQYTRETEHTPEADDGDCTTVLFCAECGKVAKAARPSHTGGTASCTARAECDVCGTAYGETLPHTPDTDDNNCATALLCTVCDSILLEARTHSFSGDAAYAFDDEGHWRICANSGCSVTNRETDTHPHSYGSFYIPSHDISIHVRECVCGKTEWGAHIPLADDGNCATEILCEICDLTAVRAKTHVFAGDYSSDSKGHRRVCANAGCLETEEFPHAFGGWSPDESNTSRHTHTCRTCGYTETALHDFESGSYRANELHHWKQCADCIAQNTAEKQAHSGGRATCTEKAVCEVCFTSYGSFDPTNHDYAFHYNDSAHFDQCRRCEKRINSYAHTLDYGTRVSDGSSEEERVHTFFEFCTGCDYSKVLATDIRIEHTGAAAFGAVEATCETAGMRAGLLCPDCGHIYVEPVEIPAKGHSALPESFVDGKQATCSKEGVIAHEKCQWCACALDGNGEKLATTVIPKLNHTMKRADGSLLEISLAYVYDLTLFPEFIYSCIGMPPTSDRAGTATFLCDCCGETVFVSVIGHAFVRETDAENHWFRCEVPDCGEIKDLMPHQYIDTVCYVCGAERPHAYGLTYSLNSDMSSYTVTGIGSCTDTHLVIPNSYRGLPVVAIGAGAFQNCTALISVTIPGSVKRIESSAFCGCTSLVSVDIFDATVGIDSFTFDASRNITLTLTNGKTFVFTGCGPALDAALASVTVHPDKSITATLAGGMTVPYGALESFSISSAFEFIATTSGGQKINLGTLLGDKSIFDREIADMGVLADGSLFIAFCDGTVQTLFKTSMIGTDASIESMTFDADKNIRVTLTNGESVTLAGFGPTLDAMLSSVTLHPDRSISATLKSGMTLPYGTLESFRISSALEFIVTNTAGRIVNLGVLSDPEGIFDIEIKDIVIDGAGNIIAILADGTESILWHVPAEDVGSTGLTVIGNAAFRGCTSLTDIRIPASVTTVGDHAFYGCDRLASVLFGERSALTRIGKYAFAYCESLASVVIPARVTDIGDYAFCGCTQLSSITLPDTLKRIGEMAFFDTAYYMDEGNLEEGVLYLGKHLIKASDTLSSTYEVKEGTVCIAASAFYGCAELTAVILPDSVTGIGHHAFYECTSLTAINIPEGVTEIGNYAFFCCPGLPDFTDPDMGDLSWDLIPEV